MKVTLTAFIPTQDQLLAGCPQLTPEMTSAVGARYSRNDGGLEEILALIDRNKSQDASIDSIFKMVDYGHASIADMAPVPIFIDKISIWLTYYIWSICPRASGQETSTRYVKFNDGGIISPELAGITEDKIDTWNQFINDSIAHYQEATQFWTNVANDNPELVKIPNEVLEMSKEQDDPRGHKARLTIERLKRNFVFDRARYFIPVAALTNVMLVMPARDWVELVRTLGSHYVPEARQLATMLIDQLKLVVPRLIKHCTPTEDRRMGHLVDLEEDSKFNTYAYDIFVTTDPRWDPLYPNILDVVNTDFKYHTNRYARIGRSADRITIKFAIPNIAMAELRDLNRHRTGYKYCPTKPSGFYGAVDQLSMEKTKDNSFLERIIFGRRACERQKVLVVQLDQSHAYWGLLGTQYYYEHGTTLAKVAYEIALRTGPGSHYKYAEHMTEVHDKLVEIIPSLKGKILLGSAEPE